MASVLIATFPAHGHVTPLLAVAAHLVQRGDRVRFLTGGRFRSAIEATGATFLPFPDEADFDDQQDLATTFPERTGLKGAKAIAFDIEHVFVLPGRAQYDAITAAHGEERVDALLVDPALCGAALLLGGSRADRPPVVVCGVLPLTISSRDTAPYGMGLMPMKGPLGRLRNAALTALAERTVFPGAQREADDVHGALHGRPVGYSVMDFPRHADAIVQFTVPEFEYPRSDAPPFLDFAGPISATGSTAPLPPWWGDLDGTRPVVHLTQGTVANKDHRQVIAPALEALAGDDVLVVVATGGRPVDTLPRLPENARAAEFLPYDDLLPRTDVYVTNGGYGGVQYALRYGVPIVTSGGKEDKPEVAARVAWSGVGVRLRSETPSADAVGTAVRQVLADHRYRDAARRIAASMAEAPGVDLVAEVVDRLASDSRRPA